MPRWAKRREAFDAKILTLAAMMVLVLGPLTGGDAPAKSCRDAKGKSTKCAAAPANNQLPGYQGQEVR
jgi:hypothetical protein